MIGYDESAPVTYACATCGSTEDVALCMLNLEDIDLCGACQDRVWCSECSLRLDDCECDERTVRMDVDTDLLHDLEAAE